MFLNDLFNLIGLAEDNLVLKQERRGAPVLAFLGARGDSDEDESCGAVANRTERVTGRVEGWGAWFAGDDEEEDREELRK